MENKQFIDQIEIPELDEKILEQITNFRKTSRFKVDIKKLETEGDIIEVDNGLESDDPDGEDDFQFADFNNDVNDEIKYFDDVTKTMVDISGDRGVFKRVIKPGVGPIVPDNSLCRINYSAYLKDETEPFDSTLFRNKHFLIKIGTEGNGLLGLLVGLATMRKGEIAHLYLSPDYAYGELGCPPRIPRNAYIFFEVELVNFISQPSLIKYNEIYSSDNEKKPFDQMLQLANSLNNQANDHFNHKEYKQSMNFYAKALNILEMANLSNDAEEQEMNDLCIKIYRNVSLCCLRTAKYKYCVKLCKKVLDLIPEDNKATYLMAKGYKYLGNFEKALELLKKCQAIDPKNKFINQELVDIHKDIENIKKMEINFSQKMFGTETILKSKLNKNPQSSKINSTDMSSDYEDKLIQHFTQKLKLFNENQNINSINIPNKFDKIQLSKFTDAADSMQLDYKINTNVINLTKKNKK